MDTFITILFFAIILSLSVGSWQNWFKSEFEKENDRREMGWFVSKVGDIIVWIFTLYGLYIAFVIIKSLWKLA